MGLVVPRVATGKNSLPNGLSGAKITMPVSANYLALDLGAESGRGLVGHFNGKHLTLEEIHRFPNTPVQMLDTLYWDVPELFAQLKIAIGKTVSHSIQLDAIGIDTWGVDFGLVGRSDTLLGNAVHYRDRRTDGVLEKAATYISRTRIYEITGLQFLPFNTIYQLLALRLNYSPLLDVAETLLMMPDLFGWLLTGRRVGERTNASTTQLLDAHTGEWSTELCNALSIPRAILPPLLDPGMEIGPILPSITQELGLPTSVTLIAPPTHDTASAVVAVPAGSTAKTQSDPPDWCYLSSGTWSLLGVEISHPVINDQTIKYNFTNEGGADGTTRLLKNIMGLWLVQECRRTWARAGYNFSYEEIISRAASAPAFGALIHPDDSSFLTPGDMPSRLKQYCMRTGQRPPADEGEMVRSCMEGLALKYRWTIERLEAILQTSIRVIHVVGGGSKNALLCQFTANACGRPVHAGPVEATAIGNILIQAMGRGHLASLSDVRTIVAQSFPVTIYEPRDTTLWDEHAERFEQLIGT
jgi:rhamnulokinase